MVTEFGIHYRLENCATEQTISLAICEERKYGSIFLLFPLNRIFKQTQKEWPLNRCFRRIFFLFTISGCFAKRGGGLIWHGTRLVGVYLMLSGWSADRRIIKEGLFVCLFLWQTGLGKKGDISTNSKTLFIVGAGTSQLSKKLTIQEIIHVG